MQQGGNMRLTNLALATACALLVLAALTSSASAARLSLTQPRPEASWTRMNFRGGLGTVECELILNKTLHSRTIVKTAGLLIGYITAANIIRCPRGSATILRETLPWHEQYDSFAGILPNITAIRTRIIGFAGRFCEPTFGICCLLRSSVTEPGFLIYNRNTATGAITSVSLSGTIRCAEFNGVLEGTSSSVTPVTVTLI